MLKLSLTILIIFSLLFTSIDCSIFKTDNSPENYFMPLVIGNKWYYIFYPSRENDKIRAISEIIAIDTIKNKKYYLVRNSNILTDSIAEYYSRQRISNDTLFSLNYDNNSHQYFERIDAIFSLKLNQKVTIHIYDKIPDSEGKKAIEQLPQMNSYIMQVISKNKNIIEFVIDYGGADANYKATYQRGVGLIKIINSWGVGKEINNYVIKD
jgi:hypothetical protein